MSQGQRGNGSKAKLLAYMLSNVGRVLTSDELREASGNASEWGRRVRELRDEQGYSIQTHNDRSDLSPGEYVLVDTERGPRRERGISKETRALVLDRDGYTCQSCGAVAGEPNPHDGRPTRLQLGHWIDKSQGGTDDASNLRALCSVCNEGAANITTARPDHEKLLAQVRRAPGSEQVKVLEKLVRKYPNETSQVLLSLEDEHSKAKDKK
ncbi:HNH endonuclease [Cupriavidus pinatubonensis]|uniref:HNH endonuclease n=1 Tax=Cupriavidus pinatubonensis TaxID=248026 RepID=UPI0036186A6E